MATTKKAVGLTIEKFIRHFKTCTGWKCEAGMRITDELTAFATAHLGSTSNFRLSEKARQMRVGARGFLRFAKLSRCDRSRV